MNWYLEAMKKYAVFQGRARRKEYWFFALFNTIGFVVLVIVDAVAGTMAEGSFIGLFSGLYWLATFLPAIAVMVRRLHDTNRSGWWSLLAFVPVGGLVILVFAVQDGNPGPNQYGPDPKAAERGMAYAAAAYPSYGNPQMPVNPQYANPQMPPNTPYVSPPVNPQYANPQMPSNTQYVSPPVNPQYANPQMPPNTPYVSPQVNPQYANPPAQAMAQAAAAAASAPQQPETVPTHNFCSGCGKPLAAGSKFCATCGQAV